jgi:hypothetical protein
MGFVSMPTAPLYADLVPGRIAVPADDATLRRLTLQFRRDLPDLFPHYGLTAEATLAAARQVLAAKGGRAAAKP